MFKLRLPVLLALLLSAFIWLGASMPVAAQPFLIASATNPSSGATTLFSFSGQQPTNLGVKDGKLAQCPASPNCVSSQSPETDTEHNTAPLTFTSTSANALITLKAVIEDMPRTKVITEADSYLYAEFKSALMGFVDDVEFYLDRDAEVIHVRSASRLGQSDLGVNRKRIEEIRAKFAATEANAESYTTSSNV